MSILITICARGGSKGLKNKALIKLKNKKLIDYTLDILKKINFKFKVVISSDSNNIINHCAKKGFDIWFKRSRNLSNDKVGKIPVIKDALIRSEMYYNTTFDTIIDLDITSPLRNVIDINKAYNIFKKTNSDNLFSVMKSRHNPYFNMVEIKNNKIKLIKEKNVVLRRQDVPITYDINASIYIWKRDVLLMSKSLFNKKTNLYEMPYERSIDIDNNIDLKIVKSLLIS